MGAFSKSYYFFNYYFTLVVTQMFILCGVYYSIESLPAALQSFVQALPLTHAVTLVRPLLADLPLTQYRATSWGVTALHGLRLLPGGHPCAVD